MRVAYILPSFPANDADWCIPVIRNFIEQISDHVEPVVYALHYPYKLTTYTIRGVTVHCLSERLRRKGGKLPIWFRLNEMVIRDHKRNPYNLIHSFWGTETGYRGSRIARKLGIPSIVSLAGGEFAEEKRARYGAKLSTTGRLLVKSTLNNATSLTTGSDWLAERVPQQYKQKVRTLPLGLDPTFFTPGSVRSGKRLLSVASVIPVKNYPTLLRAIALARNDYPDLSLTIAGWNGNLTELSRVEELIKALSLQHVVEIFGEVPHERMPALYHEHDLLLHSSLYEAQGMAMLEALSTGMPVIATNVGIVPSLPAELVYPFAPEDVEEMARQILHSLSNGEHAKTAYRRGPEIIRERFDAGDVAQRFVDLYQSVLRERTVSA